MALMTVNSERLRISDRRPGGQRTGRWTLACVCSEARSSKSSAGSWGVEANWIAACETSFSTVAERASRVDPVLVDSPRTDD
jgi:hypothetical protein